MSTTTPPVTVAEELKTSLEILPEPPSESTHMATCHLLIVVNAEGARLLVQKWIGRKKGVPNVWACLPEMIVTEPPPEAQAETPANTAP